MHKIVISAASVLFCLVASLFVANLQEATACPGSNSVNWTPETAQVSDVNGAFEYDSAYLTWEFIETPYIGHAEIYGAGSSHIEDAAYNPDYFYPTLCEGSVGIEISGNLESLQTSGSLRSRGWVWDSGSPPPFAESYEMVLTIN